MPVSKKERLRRAGIGIAKAHARARARPFPKDKLCRKCNRVLPVNRDNWNYQKRRTVAGEVYEYITSPCKECKNEVCRLANERRAAADPEGFARARAKSRTKYRAKNRAKIRRDQIARYFAKTGRSIDDSPTYGPGKAERVSVTPFNEWFDEWKAATGVDNAEIARRVVRQDEDGAINTAAVLRRLYAYSHEQERGSIEFIDRVFLAAGMPHLLSILYPVGDED